MVRHHVHADVYGDVDAPELSRSVYRQLRASAILEGTEEGDPGGPCDACDSGYGSGSACSDGACGSTFGTFKVRQSGVGSTWSPPEFDIAVAGRLSNAFKVFSHPS